MFTRSDRTVRNAPARTTWPGHVGRALLLSVLPGLLAAQAATPVCVNIQVPVFFALAWSVRTATTGDSTKTGSIFEKHENQKSMDGTYNVARGHTALATSARDSRLPRYLIHVTSGSRQRFRGSYSSKDMTTDSPVRRPR